MVKQQGTTDTTVRIQARIKGLAPGLLMHSGNLADPLSEASKAIKEISSRRKKSDEDHIEMAKREFYGSMYFDPKLGPVMPGLCLEATLIEGAKRSKNGKAFRAQVYADSEAYPMIYDGPRDLKKLWEDENFRSTLGVRVNTSRVMRTRPLFKDWALEFGLQILPGELNPEDVRTALINAGTYSGLCDFRPKYGRFTLEDFRVL